MWRLPWPLLLAFKEDELLKGLLFGKKKDLEEGRAYLMKEKKPEKALAAFQRAVDSGWRPMYITRQHPNHIVRRRGDKDIRVVWLSTTLGKDYIDPHNLNSLSNLIANFVTDGPRAVILLDGIEYLMINNDFARILHLLEFVHQGSRAAPSYAEGLLVADRTEDPRFQIRIGGSFFAPRPAGDPDDLPPGKGTPRSLADLEIPHETVAGEWAVVAGESDLVAAKSAGGVFLANGPEFERSPREFVAAVRAVREALGPSKVVAVTGLATPSNLAVLVYAGIDVVDSSRMMLDGARGLFHTADGTVPVAEADRDACGCPACAAGEALAAPHAPALYREMLLR